jgi:hypothetical protein
MIDESGETTTLLGVRAPIAIAATLVPGVTHDLLVMDASPKVAVIAATSFINRLGRKEVIKAPEHALRIIAGNRGVARIFLPVGATTILAPLALTAVKGDWTPGVVIAVLVGAIFLRVGWTSGRDSSNMPTAADLHRHLEALS